MTQTMRQRKNNRQLHRAGKWRRLEVFCALFLSVSFLCKPVR